MILIKSLVYSCVNFQLMFGVNFRFICWERERVLCSQKHQLPRVSDGLRGTGAVALSGNVPDCG